jgi:hypothetical protein
MVALLITAAATAVAAEDEFTLGLETLDLTPRDPRTEARLAQWNSPMGRMMYDMHQQLSQLQRGGQPGGSGGLAFRVGLQSGVAAAIVAASVDAGVELYERSVEVVEWPWHSSEETALPIDKQLSLLLGRRLENHSIGGADEGEEAAEGVEDEGATSADGD